MDYGRPTLADRLASEYVLGTLRGPARRRFVALLPAHPVLQRAVREWEQRLVPLSASVPPVEPPSRIWAAVQQRLFGSAAAAAPARGWQRLALWRGLTGLATAAAVGFFVVAIQPPPAQAPLVVVLSAPAPAAGAAAVKASFVASVSADGRALVLQPLDAPALTPAQALELWAVPAQGAPRSLGLVQAGARTRVLRDALLRDTAAFAISVEPAGGSPTGAPTGPIVSVGSLRL